jgi:hypothetical protein
MCCVSLSSNTKKLAVEQTLAPQRNHAQCHNRTHGTAASDVVVARLFGHLVGQRQQLVRDFEAQRLRGLEVDHELELGRQ